MYCGLRGFEQSTTLYLRVVASLQACSRGTFVTGFGKTCIIHTTDFAYSEIHITTGNSTYTDLKFSGMIEE